ncbi:elongation factor P [Aurantiacibacter sp. D1-12]|uniref:elongation factor P n=1 Tax=Aurantiacibacter sp. D1-12 TaxID=2993658 RepID=UPI00237CEBF1|nr:elongation factor P [Aurantiacibacter sp. D1-12]MDE1466867.1 elongation factor P [Aurantiacibacter sp. D1-12]
MKQALFPIVMLGTLAAVPALAQGQIGTVERGRYVCEMPGDAGGAVGIEQPEENFTIRSASRYSSPQGNGTYLRRGNTLTMTSGPRNGDRYRIQSDGFLRKIVDGEPGRLRCVRSGR